MTRKSLLLLALAGLCAPASALAQRCPGENMGAQGLFPTPAIVGLAISNGEAASANPTSLPASPPQVRIVGGTERLGQIIFTVRFAEQIFAGCALGIEIFDSRLPPSASGSSLGQFADLNVIDHEPTSMGRADGSDMVRFAFQTGRSDRAAALDKLVFRVQGRPELFPFTANIEPVTLGPVTTNRSSISYGEEIVVRAETPAAVADGLGRGAVAVALTLEPAGSALRLDGGQPLTHFTPGFRPARAERTLKGGFVREPTMVNLVATIARQRTQVPVQVLPWSCQPDLLFRAEPGHVVVAMGNSGTAGCPAMTAKLTGVASTQAVPAVAAGVKPAVPAAAPSPPLKPVAALPTNRLRSVATTANPAPTPGWVGRFAIPGAALTVGGLTLTLTPVGGDAIPFTWRPTLAEQATLRTAPPK